MSSDDLTKQLPKDRLDQLISLVEGIDARLSSLELKVDAIDTQLKSLESKVDAIDIRLNSLESKVDTLDGRLSSLETTVDNRLKETRPIWEGLVLRIEKVEINLDKVHTIALDLRSDFRDWRLTIGERVDRLESKAS